MCRSYLSPFLTSFWRFHCIYRWLDLIYRYRKLGWMQFEGIFVHSYKRLPDVWVVGDRRFCELFVEEVAEFFGVVSKCLSPNVMVVLFWRFCGFVEPFRVFQRHLWPLLKAELSRSSCHFLRLCSSSSLLIWQASTLILGSDGSDERMLCLLSARMAVAAGKNGWSSAGRDEEGFGFIRILAMVLNLI